MIIQKISKGLKFLLPFKPQDSQSLYSPTPYLKSHYLQSIYELYSPHIEVPFERERVFFTDGGHVSLDWLGKSDVHEEKPVILIMHGMTGGSETKYIRALA